MIAPAPRADAKGDHLYWAGVRLFHALFASLWRTRVHGLAQVPRTGPLIVAANHASFADPPLVGSFLPRAVYFMAKEELFRVPFFGWLIGRVHAFPIRRREGDVGAIKTAQRILGAGGALIVFPQGNRQKHGNWGTPKRGIGLLARKTRAPVLPAYVHNTHRTWRLAPLSVTFGSPLHIHDGENAETFSHRVLDAIRHLSETPHGSPR